jgi:ABC-2 type transport system ATP-binding protein
VVESAVADPQQAVVSARGVVKRYGRTVALAGLDADNGSGITASSARMAPARRRSSRSCWAPLRSRDNGELTVLARDPATAGIEVRTRIGAAPAYDDVPPELSATDFVRHLAVMDPLPRRKRPSRAGRGGYRR